MRISKQNITPEQALKSYFRRVTNEIITSRDSDSIMSKLSELNKRASDNTLNGN